MTTKPFRERLAFESITLSNGMKVYYQIDTSVDFVHCSLTAPVGSSHNTDNILTGSFHYLEHMVMKRSEKYPETRSLKEKAVLLGGSFNASTSPITTSYELSTPSEYFPEMFEGIVSHFFYPIFDPAETAEEAGVIISERKRMAPFYPAGTERGQYLRTEWMQDMWYSLDQVMGTDEDLKKMTPEYLKNIHRYYYSDKSYAVVVGNFSIETVRQHLEPISLQKDMIMPRSNYLPITWKDPSYRSFATKEVSRKEYWLGWNHPLDMKTSGFHNCMMGVLGTMLTSYTLGSLMQWLRHEKKWVYSVTFGTSISRGYASGTVVVPLNSDEEVATVRKELVERIETTLKDKNLLEKVKGVKRASAVFWYQTVGNRMSDAEENLYRLGRIETEKEYFDMLESLTCEHLQEWFATKVKPNLGEILLVPKEEK